MGVLKKEKIAILGIGPEVGMGNWRGRSSRTLHHSLITARLLDDELLVSGDALFTNRRKQIIALPRRHAIPAIYEWGVLGRISRSRRSRRCGS